jgi:N-acetylglucosamine malate deacetylase 1
MQQIMVCEYFKGTGLIVVPHMDDEVLACGGLIAQLPQKSAWHTVYVTDGLGSPEPIIPWRDCISPDLGDVRRAEAEAAMTYLGIAASNLHFLNLPDGRLQHHKSRLRQNLLKLIEKIQPDHVLAPFRFDRHPDHLAVNHCLTDLVLSQAVPWQLTEYFVYYQWRLLPQGDVRCYIRADLLDVLNIEAVSVQKRAALDCFKSQTTHFYPWQARPNLTPELLDNVSREPEFFLRYDPTVHGAAIFARGTLWIRIAHRLEPIMKKYKDRFVAWWRRGMRLG